MPAAEPAPSAPRRPFATLVCPQCADELTPRGDSLACPRGHSYDLARQGYVGLLSGGRHVPSSDTAEMVQARADTLSGGLYSHLTDALARLAAAHCPPDARVLDAGTGTGHYLAAVLEALPGAVGLGLDASKYAVRRAARAHPRAGAATWDLWQPLPVRTGSTDLLLNVFAPRNAAEYHRVLTPSGTLLVVTPADGHLAELREPLGLLAVAEAKKDRLERSLGDHFGSAGAEVVGGPLSLTREQAVGLVLMGPTGHHVSAAELRERAERGLPDRCTATTAFRLSVHRPRAGA
ncbi:putative RNA methyltransferase [Streptomyces sp. XM4193]|uniref:putative RNA methyltransferase n=1 Tax=Streptomyces sp. XM4193 TaxID=2929782 RepID=UPI0024A62981|nr:methyltransferase type 11 [Streptomyces sp. XM4193]